MHSLAQTTLHRIPPGLRQMVIAAFYFSIVNLLVKIAGQRLPSSQMVFARSIISLLITLVLLRQAGVGLWGQRKGLLFFRGVAGFTALLCLFYAIPLLPLADVTVLFFTNPVFTALFAALFLGEVLGWKEVLGLVLSLLGVLLVAQPSFLFGTVAETLNMIAVGATLAAAIAAGIAYTTIRKLGETEHHLVVVLYFPLIATPSSVPLMVPEALWPTPAEWMLLLGIGLFTQLAQIHMTKGLHAERAGRAMSISYIQIVFAAIWGLLFFDEFPNLLGLAGTVLVVAGTLAVIQAKAS